MSNVKHRGSEENNLPLEYVKWYDAVEFCNYLSEKEGLVKCYSGSGKSIQCNFKASGYRLPTEAEWEYAAKGGKYSKGYKYSGSNNLDEEQTSFIAEIKERVRKVSILFFKTCSISYMGVKFYSPLFFISLRLFSNFDFTTDNEGKFGLMGFMISNFNNRFWVTHLPYENLHPCKLICAV